MTRTTTLVLAAALALSACSPSDGPQAGSQTNWLTLCDSSEECGELECICGACTAGCESEGACGHLPTSSCIPASDDGAIALCSGYAPTSGLCLPRCDESCDEGLSCVAGVCVPTGVPTARVTVDTSVRNETLVGFGASLSYAEDPIVASADKDALYDLVFEASGLDLLRMGNRFSGGASPDLSAPSEIVAAASERLGHAPLLFLTSATPPATLKASGMTMCAGDEDTCTLATLPAGGFDYDGFATFWRTALEGYADAGITPDWVGIQNDPDWVPPADEPHEACRMLPEEGTATVTIDGADVDVTYPGYAQALSAVRAATADLPVVPQFLAPEASELHMLDEYAAALDPATFDALAVHLYEFEEAAADPAEFTSVRDLGQQLARPVFQTEMQSGGLETAVLIHHSLALGGASAYLQNDLVSVTQEMAPVALVLLTSDGLEPQGPYYALSQFAKSTDPGWVRVDAASDSSDVLAAAWLSPDEDALTLVLVNPSDEDRDAELAIPDDLRSRLSHTTVTRTVFEGVERSAALGELPASDIVRLPGGSIVTVALTQ